MKMTTATAINAKVTQKNGFRRKCSIGGRLRHNGDAFELGRGGVQSPRLMQLLILGNQCRLMPIVKVKLWEGVSKDAVERIISGITDVFVEIGIPERAVEIVVQEIPKSHWGVGGKPASKAMPDEEPP
ncbi:MAG: tautomerase family protein [Candidatus Thorarchaeota archaeon]